MPLALTPRWIALINLTALAATLAMNFLANALPINGLNTGEVSALYPNLFVPAGLTFSIWGLIYLLLLLFVLYPWRRMAAGDARGGELLQAIGPWFAIGCLANMSWIWAWHHQAVLISLLFMLVLLVSLVALYLRLQVSRRLVRPAEKLAMQVPVSIYLGWICIATIANVTALLVSFGWRGGGLGEVFWAGTMIAAGGALGLLFLRWRGDLLFTATLCWAFLGIVFRRMAEGGRWDPVGLCALAFMVLLAIAAGLRARRDLRGA